MSVKKVIKKKNIEKKYNICIVGAGHVGLVAAACFAELGHSVICVDNDKQRINFLNKDILPFYEPALKPLVKKGRASKNLVFSLSLAESVKKSEVIFIAVGTPPQADGSADLTAIGEVARIIAQNLNSYKVIVEKSTVPVQTGKNVKETVMRYKKTDHDFDIVSNPEFLREGKAIHDFFYPDRIVLGVGSKRAEKILREIYASIDADIIVTDINTAEIIKHASNSFLATKISFINAISRICDLSGADVEKVAAAMGMDKRIGKAFLQAGIGYGGFCFPKDVEAFIYISKKLGYDFNLLKEVRNINQDQREHFVEKIKEQLWLIKGKNIGICGLSFKPDTDDMRFAPSIDIVNKLLDGGAYLKVYDPQAESEALQIFGNNDKIKFVKNPYLAATNCDCLCFLTEWNEFKELDFAKIKKVMAYPLVMDGRNMFSEAALTKVGIEYVGMGKPKKKKIKGS